MTRRFCASFRLSSTYAQPAPKTRNHRLLGPPARRQSPGSSGGGRPSGISAAAGIADATGAIISCFATAGIADNVTCAVAAGIPKICRCTEAAGFAEGAGAVAAEGFVTPADRAGATDAAGLVVVAGVIA
ncbi:MAG: hypothetical protein OEW16_12635, partial [Gammaproteobacteria bacterium]|nr:hypothetical protein [Gammaproteobacteria bacterium]